MKEINTEIKERESKDFTEEQTEIKSVDGLNPILETVTTDSGTKRILIFIIALLVSLSIDLAGCKLFELYENKLNEFKQNKYNESSSSLIGFMQEEQKIKQQEATAMNTIEDKTNKENNNK